jgi:hypothetical protein
MEGSRLDGGCFYRSSSLSRFLGLNLLNEGQRERQILELEAGTTVGVVVHLGAQLFVVPPAEQPVRSEGVVFIDNIDGGAGAVRNEPVTLVPGVGTEEKLVIGLASPGAMAEEVELLIDKLVSCPDAVLDHREEVGLNVFSYQQTDAEERFGESGDIAHDRDS